MNPQTIRTTLVLGLTVAGLTLFDRFLASSETRDRHDAAAQAFEAGSQLLRQQHADQAVEELRKAWVLDRRNPGFALALGNALARTGKNAQAETLVGDALDREPNDGEANLAAARLRVQAGDPAGAEPYYHRAIYGVWAGRAADRRSAARLELIDVLRKENKPAEMLGELISLEGEAGNSGIQEQIAPLFLAAGSPQRAAAAWQAVTERDPGDPDAWQGLGQSDLQLGLYREARIAFRRAADLRPGPQVDSRLNLLDILTPLDPTPRRLASVEKYRRSRRILELALGDLEQVSSAAPLQDAEIADLITRGHTELSRKDPAQVTNELSESILSLAEQIWKARIRAFGTPNDSSHEALRLIMEHLSG